MMPGGGRGEGLRRTEREIAAEKAAALGRAGERLEQALADVAALAARLDAAGSPDDRARVQGEYDLAWERAAAARLALLVQREAVGLRQHRLVDQQFPEPPRRRAPPTRVTRDAGASPGSSDRR
jgi:hypothetical protein